jgi:His-Xaa-Ser system radical SAM maturase HxsB
MPLSYFPQTLNEEYISNKYSHLKFGKDKNLITLDHGSWCLLSDKEFDKLRKLKVHKDSNLFNFLKEKGVIVTEDNFNKIVKDYRERFHFLFRGPTLHIVAPTFRCNFNCVYCHSLPKNPKAKGWDMGEDTAKEIVDFIFTSPSKLLSIEFQGGDCLLNFDVVKFIIEYAEEIAKEQQKKVKFSIVTNLTLMNDEILDFLKEHKIMGISTSFDGPKNVHNANRKYIDGTGSYDDVLQWIRIIKTEFKKDFNLNALTTVTKFSIPYPKEIVDEFLSLGFNSVWFRFLNNLGFAHPKIKKIGYSPEEYIKFWKEGLNYIIEKNKSGRIFQEVYTKILSHKILNEEDPMFVDIQSPCGAGIGQLLYNHKGDIFTCDEAKILGNTFKLGHVGKNSLKEIIRNPTTLSLINISSKLPTLCDNCAFSP